MDGYMMFAQKLKVEVIPRSRQHPALMRGSKKPFKASVTLQQPSHTRGLSLVPPGLVNAQSHPDKRNAFGQVALGCTTSGAPHPLPNPPEIISIDLCSKTSYIGHSSRTFICVCLERQLLASGAMWHALEQRCLGTAARLLLSLLTSQAGARLSMHRGLPAVYIAQFHAMSMMSANDIQQFGDKAWTLDTQHMRAGCSHSRMASNRAQRAA